MRIGDRVRDRAGLGGIILTIWYDWVGVGWNNGTDCWIEAKWLTVERHEVCS